MNTWNLFSPHILFSSFAFVSNGNLIISRRCCFESYRWNYYDSYFFFFVLKKLAKVISQCAGTSRYVWVFIGSWYNILIRFFFHDRSVTQRKNKLLAPTTIWFLLKNLLFLRGKTYSHIINWITVDFLFILVFYNVTTHKDYPYNEISKNMFSKVCNLSIVIFLWWIDRSFYLMHENKIKNNGACHKYVEWKKLQYNSNNFMHKYDELKQY